MLTGAHLRRAVLFEYSDRLDAWRRRLTLRPAEASIIAQAPTRVQRGFIVAAIPVLLTWAFGFGWNVRTCEAGPGVIPRYIIWGTEIIFILTLPVTVGAFALGYFVRFRVSWPRLLVGVVVLLAVCVGPGFALATPGFCSPSL